MAQRRFINLPDHRPEWPFSDGVLVGDTLYLSGRIGFAPDGTLPDSPEAQAGHILDGISAVLAAAGMTMDDLVYVQVFCPDVSLFDRFNVVYRAFFTRDLPARAFLGSGPLLFGAKFEVQGIAVKESHPRGARTMTAAEVVVTTS